MLYKFHGNFFRIFSGVSSRISSGVSQNAFFTASRNLFGSSSKKFKQFFREIHQKFRRKLFSHFEKFLRGLLHFENFFRIFSENSFKRFNGNLLRSTCVSSTGNLAKTKVQDNIFTSSFVPPGVSPKITPRNNSSIC